jgi:hypothetical protein
MSQGSGVERLSRHEARWSTQDRKIGLPCSARGLQARRQAVRQILPLDGTFQAPHARFDSGRFSQYRLPKACDKVGEAQECGPRVVKERATHSAVAIDNSDS